MTGPSCTLTKMNQFNEFLRIYKSKLVKSFALVFIFRFERREKFTVTIEIKNQINCNLFSCERWRNTESSRRSKLTKILYRVNEWTIRVRTRVSSFKIINPLGDERVPNQGRSTKEFQMNWLL